MPLVMTVPVLLTPKRRHTPVRPSATTKTCHVQYTPLVMTVPVPPTPLRRKTPVHLSIATTAHQPTTLRAWHTQPDTASTLRPATPARLTAPLQPITLMEAINPTTPCIALQIPTQPQPLSNMLRPVATNKATAFFAEHMQIEQGLTLARNQKPHAKLLLPPTTLPAHV